MNKIRRILVEKASPANVESIGFTSDIKNNLFIGGLVSARVINCYDIAGITDDVYEKCITAVFTEPPVDIYYEQAFCLAQDELGFGVKYLPGQYDQRADWAEQAIKIIIGDDGGQKPIVISSKIYVLKGNINEDELSKIKAYVINPVDSMEIGLEKPKSLTLETVVPEHVKILESFIAMNDAELENLRQGLGLAMSFEDMKHCKHYFTSIENRNPTITEIKVLDTYWSDHCRHTTFQTNIKNIEIKESKYSEPIQDALQLYLQAREEIHGGKNKPLCLMDMAQMGARVLKKQGLLNNLDESEEINACSIKVKVDVDGTDEEWLVMFKNETHNHPTEIEPFGGAATCLGGAIRDPLSGRSYVYQAMRVTGSGDPRVNIKDTLAGKLPQRKITLGAAAGYSSYGNQIGLATGQVTEIYNEGYIAKRMEIGAVVGAVKAENVVRERPEKGDAVILVGGRTGRDGCGGATGSSKVHTDESILESGAEVQKGNAPTERKLQRLFRKAEVTALIKRCNDFGAGGVSVAVGELADGLEIDLDKVLKKYDGLDGTELAISESQERMAVVVARENMDAFIEQAAEENLEAVSVAKVTDDRRLIMRWRDNDIVNISRDFLDTNGAEQFACAVVEPPLKPSQSTLNSKNLKENWLINLKNLNVCSQKGLAERFDATIGAATVLMPFGGKKQLTPAVAMAAKIPVEKGFTNTATIMSFGFDPEIASWSPFHGAVYAVVDSVAKNVAVGGDPANIKLTFQEYFERLYDEPQRWGKPVSALLGAYAAQIGMEIASIGGKDSMSGTFNDIDVPPTLVSFAINVADARKMISPEFKKAGNCIAVLLTEKDEADMPNFKRINSLNKLVYKNIQKGNIISAHNIGFGGIAEAISKMAFGNEIGFSIECGNDELFSKNYGGYVVELSISGKEFLSSFDGFDVKILGNTTTESDFVVNGTIIEQAEALEAWLSPLESVFPTHLMKKHDNKDYTLPLFSVKERKASSKSIAKPRIMIPVFPGTNSEYDTKRAFDAAGGMGEIFVVKNMTASDLKQAAIEMASRIRNSQMIAIPGGFSAGDEPEGSGKFIAAMFKNPYIKDAVADLLNNRDGLIIGICNGFQALVKLGLLPYGEIRELTADSPTLTFNEIGRHISLIANTRVISNQSPWLWGVEAGDIHRVAVSHGEGRFLTDEKTVKMLSENGQIATQYVQLDGNAANNVEFNPNGSTYAIEGITSPDGRVFGKMGHTERAGVDVFKNIPGNYDQRIFSSGVKYFS